MSQNTNGNGQPANLPAQAKKNDLVTTTANRVHEFVKNGDLQLPMDYSVSNAMKSAWLILQEVQTKDKQPVLQACSKASIANALLDMAVQALNPQKKQCYFIAYGNKLVCQRSYHGAIALAKRFRPAIADIFAEVVYEGDDLVYEIRRGQKFVTSHKQQLTNIDKNRILGAYAEAVDAEGNVLASVLRTFEEIKAAWGMSRAYPLEKDGTLKVGSTHEKYTADMCKRTVINALCKPIINTSSDAQLFPENFKRADRIVEDHDLEEELDEHANQELIDTETGEVLEAGASDDTPKKADPVTEDAPY